MNPAELVEVSERETLLALGALEPCTLGYVPGATLLDSGVDIPSFNGVIATACSGADVASVCARASVWFAERGRPWVWRAGPGNEPPDLAVRLEDLGFSLEADEVGMARSLDEPAELAAPGAANGVIEEVTGAHGFDEWFAVFAAAFRIPGALRSPLEPVLRAASEPGGPFRNFLARVDGDAAACGTLTRGSAAAGVANIGVVPEHRRGGLGAAMAQAITATARDEGCSTAVLSATDGARELYRRLGFTETGPRRIYGRTARMRAPASPRRRGAA